MSTDPLTHRALSAYQHTGRRARMHTQLRAATCPIAELDPLVPDAGRILDIGCGHGLCTIRLALASPGRSLVGVDVDEDKISIARTAAIAAGVADRVRFDLVDPGWCPDRGSTDAVTIIDVLYLLGPRRSEQLLRASVESIGARGGTVVVKEMADSPRWKRGLTMLQEHVSVRLAGITEGAHVGLLSERSLVEPLERSGATIARVDLSDRRPHPHVAFVARVPAPPVPSRDGE